MTINRKQLQELLDLESQDRYRHFIKEVISNKQAWGLYKDGWALAATDEVQEVFLLWSAEEYAELCASGEWSQHEATPISLEDFFDELLPMLEADEILPGIFFTPEDQGTTPSVEQLKIDLQKEMSKSGS